MSDAPSVSVPEPSPQPHNVAEPPFRDDDADIILRSSDSLNFRVHRLLLSKSSPVFSDMLALPQPPRQDDASPDGLEVVDMVEDRDVLKILLGFVYAPLSLPSFGMYEFDRLKVALDLVRKYEMPGPLETLKQRLSTIAAHSPERVFALAWLYQWKSVALDAAQHIKPGRPLGSNFAEYRTIPAEALWALQDVQQRCRDIARTLACTWTSWLHPNRLGSPVAGKPNRCYCVQYRRGKRSKQWAHATTVTYWFADHMDRLYQALQKDPRIETVTSAKLLVPTINAANQCEVCKEGVFDAMDTFNSIFKAKVEQSIADVKPEIPF